MLVKIDMEIEIDDYDGKIFLEKIREAILGIDSKSNVKYFHIRDKSPNSRNEKSFRMTDIRDDYESDEPYLIV